MEPRFGASFANVRIHTDESAARQSASLQANAFTIGQDVYFGKAKFQPDSAQGRELIAHELTHTLQQGAAVQRDAISGSAAPAVTAHVTPHVQRDMLPDLGIRPWLAEKARNRFPGFELFTVLIGYNPITGGGVASGAAALLAAAIKLIPGGSQVLEALRNHNVFDQAATWASQRFDELKGVAKSAGAAVAELLRNLGSLILNPEDSWERAKALVAAPIDAIVRFATKIKEDIVKFIKTVILEPMASYARGTKSYALLATVLGKDPITNQRVPDGPDALVGGFMAFIGEEEVWANVQKANAIDRAYAWFQKAVGTLRSFVGEIPALFVRALESLDVVDIVLVPRAFAKVAGVFGGFASRFVSWGADAVWNLLEIVFEVASPGALVYVRKTGAALKSILRNPRPFAGNLVSAAKLGFNKFADHFGTHLLAGIIEWLTGAMPGVHIPQALTLSEMAKFVFSVLGLTWANIRPKLAKLVGERAVGLMEKAADPALRIVQALVNEGPGAAWDQLKTELSDLKDTVVGGIRDFLLETVVTPAVLKLVAMFVPGGGLITAIVSIYDTIKFFVEKAKSIASVVAGFVDSIVAIAGGAIESAGLRVEQALAKSLSLAIDFLARFLRLGRVTDKLMKVVKKVQTRVDKAIDSLLARLAAIARKVFGTVKAAAGKVKTAAGKLFSWAFARKSFKDADGKSHSLYVDKNGHLTVASTPQGAQEFLDWYAKRKNIEASKVEPIRKKIAEAQKKIDAISKLSAQDRTVPDAALRSLLETNTEIAAMIAKLIGKDETIGKLEEKYHLEGMTGTYEGTPKPVGDKLTPDHQPQASVIEAAVRFFKFRGFKSTSLVERADQRAKKGFTINVHFNRHIKGATYGSKGTKTETFLTHLIERAGTAKEADAKKTVAQELQKLLDVDVATMKDVAGRDSSWTDLEVITDEMERKKFRTKIADRIKAGEDQLQKQSFDF
jgi:hypothetical protein